MSAMDPKYYADVSKGSECPNCCSQDIDWTAPLNTTPAYFASPVVRPVKCNDCGATWDETFKLTGYDDLIIPEGKEI